MIHARDAGASGILIYQRNCLYSKCLCLKSFRGGTFGVHRSYDVCREKLKHRAFVAVNYGSKQCVQDKERFIAILMKLILVADVVPPVVNVEVKKRRLRWPTESTWK